MPEEIIGYGFPVTVVVAVAEAAGTPLGGNNTRGGGRAYAC